MWKLNNIVGNGGRAGLATVLSLVLVAFGALYGTLAQAQPASDQAEIQKLLAAYEKSYDSGDYEGIVKLWPSLNGDKKEAKKLKDRLSRPDISETQLHLEVVSTQPMDKGVLVHAKRNEQYMQREYSSYSSSDNMIGTMPAQNPGPSKQTSTRKVSKTGEAWIRLQHGSQGWMIESMSDKKPAGPL